MAANIRRRRQGKGAAEDSLTESLLGDDGDVRHAPLRGEEDFAEDEEPYLQPSARSAIIVHPGEFNLHAFLATIFEWWHRVFGTLWGVAAHLWPAGAREPHLSLLQAERLQSLRERVSERFDIASTLHQDALRRLWSLAFQGEPCTALKTPRWKDMGWQGDDPATDFRGAGLYGLDNLIYLAEVHPDTFRRLMDKAEGARATWEYPFAVAGLNITYMLAEVLDLHVPLGQAPRDAPPRSAAGRAFLTLLSDSDVAFEELYCATYALLDATWLEMRASYMEFNAVLKRVRGEVERALSARPADLPALRRRLLGQ